MAAEPDRETRIVVCAVEGSAVDGAVVEVAAQLAVLTEARHSRCLPLCHSRRTGAHAWGLRALTVPEARRALELTAGALESRVDVDCYLEAGNPIRRLVEFAVRRHTLLLVVGTHPQITGRPSSIVASRVSRSAPCPVVVVPEGRNSRTQARVAVNELVRA
jgi:nucleotide-binding universal stress UspA family protein